MQLKYTLVCVFDRHYVIVNIKQSRSREEADFVYMLCLVSCSSDAQIKDLHHIPRLVCSEVLFKQLCPHRAVLLHTANPCWAKLPLMCINQPNCVMGERGLYSTVVILQLYDVFSQMDLAFAFELSLKLELLCFLVFSLLVLLSWFQIWFDCLVEPPPSTSAGFTLLNISNCVYRRNTQWSTNILYIFWLPMTIY